MPRGKRCRAAPGQPAPAELRPVGAGCRQAGLAEKHRTQETGAIPLSGQAGTPAGQPCQDRWQRRIRHRRQTARSADRHPAPLSGFRRQTGQLRCRTGQGHHGSSTGFPDRTRHRRGGGRLLGSHEGPRRHPSEMGRGPLGGPCLRGHRKTVHRSRGEAITGRRGRPPGQGRRRRLEKGERDH